MKRFIGVCSVLTIAIMAFIVLGLSSGAVAIPFEVLLNSIFDLEGEKQTYIVKNSRLPRVVLALLTGSSLAISGSIIQSIVRNPLASPKIIGINSGAGFLACFMVIAFPNLPTSYLPLFACLGGLIAAATIYAIFHFKKVSPAHLALIGIGIGFLFDSGVDYFLVTASDHDISEPLVWLTGALWGRTWQHVQLVQLPLLGLMGLGFVFAYTLDLLYLGDEAATGLGLNVRLRRLALLLIATLLASLSVGVVGVMGFVGLMSPHIAKSLVGGQHKLNIPVSGLIGMLLVLVADTLGRMIAPPIEISAGLLTAIVGGPFFIYIMFFEKGRPQ